MAAVNINDIQQNVEQVQKELREERRRNELLRVIPTHSLSFIDETGNFSQAKYDAELEKRVKSNMDSSDVKELWDNKMAVEYYNIQQQQQQQQSQRRNSYNNNPRPKTASRNYEPPGNSMISNNNKTRSNLWYLDLFTTDYSSASFAKGSG
jgi:hypothetical protein